MHCMFAHFIFKSDRGILLKLGEYNIFKSKKIIYLGPNFGNTNLGV